MSNLLLPVDPQWVAHTLTPYLRYAFQHVLHRDLDMTPYIERALDSSRSKPVSYIDGDDLLFERVFFAIEHRHQDLSADIKDLTENLESLALFLIRRAQLKGSYELLARRVPPSDAWKRYERERITQMAAKNVKGYSIKAYAYVVNGKPKQPTVPTYSVLTAADLPAPSGPRMAIGPPLPNSLIDPRLLYASPGQFVAPDLSASLTLAELQHYHHQNQEIEASVAMELAQILNQQQTYGMQHPVQSSRIAAPVHQQPRYLQPSGYPSHSMMQNIQPQPVPIPSRPVPVQPGLLPTNYDNTHPSFTTLAKSAEMPTSLPEAAMFPGPTDFSDPAYCAKSMAAFKKLSREEKIAKLLEILRAEKALNSNTITPVQNIFMEAAAEQVDREMTATAGEERIKQNKGNAEGMIKLPDQQAIMVQAPSYQTRWDTFTTASGVESFRSHPAYSNIKSSFASPQSHGSFLAPTLTSEWKEGHVETKKGA